MARIDAAKEWIGHLKVILVLGTATVIGWIGWFARSYETAQAWQTSASIIGVALLALGLIRLNLQIIRDIRRLKEL